MTCPACDNAREHPTSGIFQMKCDGCAARALARSPMFFNAVQAGERTPQYSMALAQFFPGREEAGHSLVKDWVREAKRASVRAA